MKNTLIRPAAAVLLGILLHAHALAEEPRAQHGIKEDEPRTGTLLRRDSVLPFSIPINRTYAQLSADDRAKLHDWWEGIREGDEPPFPEAGLKPILDAMRKAQARLLVNGELFLIAKVDAHGDVVSVDALGSPSAEMTQFAASVMFLTKFKPAVCSGRPCRMDFPLRYKFEVTH